MSLLPPVKNEKSKHNFYLRSLDRPNLAQWYSTQVVGLNTLKKTIGEIAKSGNLEGFFTNHSLAEALPVIYFKPVYPKRSLKKLQVTDLMHSDKYEITSEEQKSEASKILAGCNNQNKQTLSLEEKELNEMEVCVTEKVNSDTSKIGCNCKRKFVKPSETAQVVDLVQSLMSARKGEKAKIKIEIEFSS